jgi:hypothetical protein
MTPDAELEMDYDSIAAVLVAELNRVSPSAVWLTSERDQHGVAVFTNTPEGRQIGTGLPERFPRGAAALPFLVESVLDGVQDDIAEVTRMPWPSDQESTEPLPEAWARVADGRLTFGYGSIQLGEDYDISGLLVERRR